MYSQIYHLPTNSMFVMIKEKLLNILLQDKSI